MTDLATRVAQRVLSQHRLTERVADRVLARTLEARGVEEGEGKKITGEDVRITVGTGSRYDMRIVLQQLPSKPIKRKLKQVVYSSAQWFHPRFAGGVLEWRVEGGGFMSLPAASWMFSSEHIAELAGFSSSSTFKAAESGLKKAVDKAANDLKKAYKSKFREAYVWDYRAKETRKAEKADLDKVIKYIDDGIKYAIETNDIFYLDVEPADYQPITVSGKGWGGTFNWQSFRFQSHKQDEFMEHVEGMTAFYQSKSPGGARKAFKLLKGDPGMVKNMDLGAFEALLTKNKIAFDYVPTVWR